LLVLALVILQASYLQQLNSPPSPLEVVLPQPPVVVDSESAEVDVTETIVLPKKTDKLDFTRFVSLLELWISCHCCSYYNDADEHSLGSCSAEVAAINSTGKKEKPKRSNGLVMASCEIRHPSRNMVKGSNFPGNLSLLEVPSIPRVASFDQVPDRSGSQEPFQTHGSVPPEDVVMRPSPSAFQSVSNFSSPPQHTSTRYQQQPSPMKDPSLAIDQLCAELELNTEQVSVYVAPLPCLEFASKRTHPVVKKAPPQRQQKSLDEVTNMLNNVVNDFHASHTLYATPHTMNQSNPFETINQEKISPSRVEAMHNMFERNLDWLTPAYWREPKANLIKTSTSVRRNWCLLPISGCVLSSIFGSNFPINEPAIPFACTIVISSVTGVTTGVLQEELPHSHMQFVAGAAPWVHPMQIERMIVASRKAILNEIWVWSDNSGSS
uniref:Lamina-associated polypeptide 2 n=1 Tax=Heligmosomoides polygyrus TaxID=6339 RepID=A0A183FRV4_HELPZ